MRTIAFLAGLLSAICLSAQMNQPVVTAAADRITSYENKRLPLIENSLAAGLPFSNIGPAVQSGRVVDIAVRPDDPTHFLVAYASGGLWKTDNNGISFAPLFQNESVMTIGAVATDWATNTIWIGSGEVNSSRSSYAGDGIYKSTDGGQTWQRMGLEDSHHIGRILIHPENPDIVIVAALGHLYSANEERGVFLTEDGGKTWTKTLFVDTESGAVEMARHPSRPNELYAATWDRTRWAWDFDEGGPGSAIYKSTDGGKTWSDINPTNSEWPSPEGRGRIGLSLSLKDGKSVLYATVDNYDRRPKETPEADVLTKEMLRTMPLEDILRLKDYLLEDFLRSNGFPRDLKAASLRQKLENKEISPIQLVEYLEDANSLLFDTPVVGLEVYQSLDGGENWKRCHEDFLDGVYNSYGYYFGRVEAAPYDADQLYVLGVPIIRSDDGGASWKNLSAGNVHSDHHAIWINPDRPGHVILGNDGGINISYDYGESWFKANTPPVGQFYAVAVDMAQPYNVYGGLQDNGVWMGPSNYRSGPGWQSSGRYPYRSIMGGDGMQVAVDTRDNQTVYTGFQFGNYFRVNTQSGRRTYITPRHELGERPFRWNWQAPIHLSVHNQDVLYMGSNFVHRSLNQGADFEIISGDLTKGGKKGDVPYGTLATIHESPLRFGLLYAGSDDGLVHISRDGGYSWKQINQGLPEDLWVSRVQASAFEEGRVYLSLNGYRWDDFRSLVYVSEDYGASWQRIGEDLPLEPVNVVKEDPTNPNLLYVGTDHGLYFSLDRGKSFQAFSNNLPAVAVHDLVVHKRDQELIVGTHGRSIYKAPIGELQQLTAENQAKPILAFAIPEQRRRGNWGSTDIRAQGRSETELLLPIYVQSAGTLNLTIQPNEGPLLWTNEYEVQAGLNFLPYHFEINPEQLEAYAAFLNKDRKEDKKPIKLEAADNGKAYLYTGKVKLSWTKDGETATTDLTLK